MRRLPSLCRVSRAMAGPLDTSASLGPSLVRGAGRDAAAVTAMSTLPRCWRQSDTG
jgi:hypothetical protein